MKVNNNQIEGVARILDGCAVVSIITNISHIFGYLNLHGNDGFYLLLSLPVPIIVGFSIRKGIK